jgi:hypothetical protein
LVRCTPGNAYILKTLVGEEFTTAINGRYLKLIVDCCSEFGRDSHVTRIWQKNTIRQEVFLKAFGRGVCGREYIVIRQEGCSTDESGSIRDYMMTWIGYKEGDELMMDTRRT